MPKTGVFFLPEVRKKTSVGAFLSESRRKGNHAEERKGVRSPCANGKRALPFFFPTSFISNIPVGKRSCRNRQKKEKVLAENSYLLKKDSFKINQISQHSAIFYIYYYIYYLSN